MKTSHSSPVARSLCMALAVLSLLMLPNSLHASLLIYEGFNGYTVGDIGGQAVNTNATGLTGNYAASQVSRANYQTNGLTFSNLVVSGGSVVQNSTTGVNFGARLDAGTFTGTLYTSYLINFSSAGDTASRAWASINQDSAISAKRTLAAIADMDNSTYAAVGYDSVTNATSSGIQLAGNTTYMVLASFSHVGSALDVTNAGVATLWVITENQFGYFQTNGFTDLNLNSASIGSGASDVFARVTNTATTGTYTFATNRYLQLSLNANSASRSYTMDEVRYGTILTDVAPIPEPTATALMALGVLGLTAFVGLRRYRVGKI